VKTPRPSFEVRERARYAIDRMSDELWWLGDMWENPQWHQRVTRARMALAELRRYLTEEGGRCETA